MEKAAKNQPDVLNSSTDFDSSFDPLHLAPCRIRMMMTMRMTTMVMTATRTSPRPRSASLLIALIKRK